MVIELVILARFMYRKRKEIQQGIESTCEHCLPGTSEHHLCTVLPCDHCGRKVDDLD